MAIKEEQYEILSSSDLLSRMMELVRDYPTFATLTTTQEWFGLPRAGEYLLTMFEPWGLNKCLIRYLYPYCCDWLWQSILVIAMNTNI